MTKITDKHKDAVLVVEDTAANHDVIRAFLNDIDVHCESAFDGMEAITACSSGDGNRYSLILMDINLPHMSGFETAEKLRSMGVRTPIIAVTASSNDELTRSAGGRVFDYVLHKPFNSTEFFTAISPYIKKASSCSLGTANGAKADDPFPAVDSQVCDVPRALSNMGNSRRLFAKHFNNFKQNNADLVMRMHSLISRGEYEECAILCHSIKGLSGMLGLTSLYEHVIEMEELLRRDPDSPDVPDAITMLLSSINNDIRLVCQLQL